MGAPMRNTNAGVTGVDKKYGEVHAGEKANRMVISGNQGLPAEE